MWYPQNWAVILPPSSVFQQHTMGIHFTVLSAASIGAHRTLLISYTAWSTEDGQEHTICLPSYDWDVISVLSLSPQPDLFE